MPTFTRKDYLDKKCNHRQYYTQFVDDGVRKRVLNQIGKDRLIHSTDEHFNDIPLYQWDNIGPFWQSIHTQMKEAGDYMTMAGIVCIAKEAARQIVEEA